jgi:hypothetical protein
LDAVHGLDQVLEAPNGPFASDNLLVRRPKIARIV